LGGSLYRSFGPSAPAPEDGAKTGWNSLRDRAADGGSLKTSQVDTDDGSNGSARCRRNNLPKCRRPVTTANAGVSRGLRGELLAANKAIQSPGPLIRDLDGFPRMTGGLNDHHVVWFVHQVRRF
jgi:hypothetical protein